MRLRFLLLLLTVGLTLQAGETSLPAARLKRPLRLHMARGLWWQALRLHEGFALAGGGELSASHDVYGSPKGYHGCGRALSAFPRTVETLNRQDIIILAGCRIAALPAKVQQRLADWVKAGGGLLITGGPLSLDRDAWAKSPLLPLLPVEIGEAKEIVPFGTETALAPTATGRAFLGDLRWTETPRAYWTHAAVTARPKADVLIKVGDKPFLVRSQPGASGRGKVVVLAATVCGDPAAGETPFWAWDDWPKAMGACLRWLAPTTAIALSDPNATSKSDRAKALARLQEIGDQELDIFDEDDDDDAAAEPAKGDAPTLGREISLLAKGCRDAQYADALLQAIAAASARLTLDEGERTFAAVAKVVTPKMAAAVWAEFVKGESVGLVALGLRLAGRAKSAGAGETMVRFAARGLDAMHKDEGAALVGSMRLPDGKDEGLRHAAMRALMDLGDPKFLAGAQKARRDWQRNHRPLPLLEDKQADLELQMLLTLAVLGDAKAARQALRQMIDNHLAQEAALDTSERRVYNPTPESNREKARAREMIPILGQRNQRVANALLRLPPVLLPALADEAKTLSGEFAAKAILLSLAAQDNAPLPAPVRAALTDLAKTSPDPAIRALCQTRCANGP